MRATLATSPALPVVACIWKVRIVLIANVDDVVNGVKNPLRTCSGCQRHLPSRMAITDQLYDHGPLQSLQHSHDNQRHWLRQLFWREAFGGNQQHHGQYR